MRILTIHQPYAELIRRGDKRVENRSWPTSYRGPLAIHAGLSLEWLDPRYCESRGIDWRSLPVGCVVAVCDLIDCLTLEDCRAMEPGCVDAWMRSHEHVEGPWCWIIAFVRPLPAPVPIKGQQGLKLFDPVALTVPGPVQTIGDLCERKTKRKAAPVVQHVSEGPFLFEEKR